MDLENLESELRSLTDNLDKESFVYDLLLAYGFPKATITRLKKGDYNQSNQHGEILWKKHLYFTTAARSELFTRIDEAKDEKRIKRQHPRFLIATDFRTLLAIDTKTADSLDIPISDLPKHGNFFLPWTGMEKSAITSENPADIKAAEKMGQLYDLLLQNNEIKDEDSRHALNVFLSRLLFCFFAEDTGIFEDDQFTKMVDSHTVEDGANLQPLLERLFRALNEEDRSAYPDYTQAFPYVNGGLFADDLPVPVFNRKARKMLIDCGALNWKAINPDIFGSMMQAVTLGEERRSIGMHYTSVVNIMKVIEPLFLNDLKEVLEKADGNEKKLEKLLDRLYHIRIFDPACGSGNFLIIAYKELCRLEIELFQQLQELNPGKWGIARSGIRLNQFFGIEIDDFAAKTAQLSMWLAEHQMNIEFHEVFGASKPTLPLAESSKILCGNALATNWLDVCPATEADEVYVLGNPPYLGSKRQSKSQKADIKAIAGHIKKFKSLDYIAGWFLLGAAYLSRSNARMAFVSTNSICQGEQVAILWSRLLEGTIEIAFAYPSFKWGNSAKGNAGVSCVIVGLREKSTAPKRIYSDGRVVNTKNISPYLIDGPNTIVARRGTSISSVPPMKIGNKPIDGGNYLFSSEEKLRFVGSEPGSAKYFRRWYGTKELLYGEERWCLLVGRIPEEELKTLPATKLLIEKVRQFRLSSDSKPTQALAATPRRFHVENFPDSEFIVVPKVSSERRPYVPIAVLNRTEIASDLLNIVSDFSPWLFGILSSHIHNLWLRTVSGRHESRYRYSAGMCYNTFPFPPVGQQGCNRIEDLALSVLDLREVYSELTLAQLYDPDLMPAELRIAHEELDIAVEQSFHLKPFDNDSERLAFLFKTYLKISQQ